MKTAIHHCLIVAAIIAASISLSCGGGKKEVKGSYFRNKENYERFVKVIIDYKKIHHLDVYSGWLNGHPYQDNNEPLDTTQWVDDIFYLKDLLSKYAIDRNVYLRFKSYLKDLNCSEFQKKEGSIIFQLGGYAEDIWGLLYKEYGKPAADWQDFYLTDTDSIEGKWFYFRGIGK